MSRMLFRNCALLVPGDPELHEGMHVLVEGETIREVSERPIAAGEATVVDVGGKTLMPGLIDCHVHVVATMLNLAANAALPNATVAYRSIPILKGMLLRGFTTVRDAGGADAFIARAV